MSASTETRITEWLAAHKDAMVDLLREVVDIDSGSYDKSGVDAVGARFERFFAEHDISAWREHHEVFGDAIHAQVADPGSNEKPILLMGHRDTVFPKGEVSRRPFTIEGGRAYGPGVADMKAGLVMNVFVAAAFKALGGAPCPIKVLITSDEEIASPSSRPIIEREGRAARAVYNSEPGRPSAMSPRAARAASSCASTSMARRPIPAAISQAASVRSEKSLTRLFRSMP